MGDRDSEDDPVDVLVSSIATLAEGLEELRARAREQGIFTNDRELLTCPICGLMEDVIANGVLITDFEENIGQDTGMRFAEDGEAPERFLCPNCGVILIQEEAEDGSSVDVVLEETPPEGVMKMYILIKDTVPLGFAMVAAAHASLAAYLKFKDSAEVAEWLSGPFKKTVCRVTEADFERAKATEDHVVLTESALNDQEVAIAFRPREEWPKAFRFYPLYR